MNILLFLKRIYIKLIRVNLRALAERHAAIFHFCDISLNEEDLFVRGNLNSYF